MADKLLSIDEVCEELQLRKEQVIALVKSGALRGFLDQNTYKFRPADVEKYKASAESSQTVAMEPGSDASDASDASEAREGDSSSKLDLSDIDSEIDADVSDQTSVLAPVDEKAEASKPEDEAVFEFSEDELGLSLDGEPPADSALVGDESESSMDILEVADESASSDSATSTADFDFMEESSSSEEVAEVEDMTPEPAQLDAESASETGEVVTDILSGSEEDISDEELDTLDLDEVVETQDTLLEEGEAAEVGGEEPGDIALEEPATGTAETVSVGDEAETAGVPAEDATQAVELGEEAEPAPDFGQEEYEPEYAAARVGPGYAREEPSKLYNTFMILTLVVLAVGGLFVLTTATNAGNPLGGLFRESILPAMESILNAIA
jgi:hypothetical protein